MRLVKPSADLLSITEMPSQLIEVCGRLCYKSEDRITHDTSEKFIAMLKKRGHVSVLEHAVATFHIVTDRGITHEIVRHRLASYSQESTRYCNYSKEKFGKEIAVVQPSWFHDPERVTQRDTWVSAMQTAEHRYFDLISDGAPPEVARSVLPTCLKTEIAMTANLREWEHFLNLRLKGATGKPHPDIRIIGYYIWRQLMEYCPPLFGQFEESAYEVEVALGKIEMVEGDDE